MSYSAKQLAQNIPVQSKEALKKLVLSEKIIYDKKFLKIINNPQVSVSEKESFLKDIFSKFLDDSLIKYMVFLLGYNSFINFKEILTEYKKILKNKKIALCGTLITAETMTNEEIKKAEDELAKNINIPVSLEAIYNPNLLGGSILKINDLTYNNSYANKLNKLR